MGPRFDALLTQLSGSNNANPKQESSIGGVAAARLISWIATSSQQKYAYSTLTASAVKEARESAMMPIKLILHIGPHGIRQAIEQHQNQGAPSILFGVDPSFTRLWGRQHLKKTSDVAVYSGEWMDLPPDMKFDEIRIIAADSSWLNHSSESWINAIAERLAPNGSLLIATSLTPQELSIDQELLKYKLSASIQSVDLPHLTEDMRKLLSDMPIQGHRITLIATQDVLSLLKIVRDRLQIAAIKGIALRHYQRTKDLLTPVLGFCLNQDPKTADDGIVREIHARNAEFNNGHHYFPTTALEDSDESESNAKRVLSWSILPYHALLLGQVASEALYSVELEWVDGYGEVIYLSRWPQPGLAAETIIYFTTSYWEDESRFAEHLHRVRNKQVDYVLGNNDRVTTTAALLGRTATLEDARLLVHDEINKYEAGELLSRAFAIDPEAAWVEGSSDARKLSELQRDLAFFHMKERWVRTTVSNAIGIPLGNNQRCVLREIGQSRVERAALKKKGT